MLKGRSARKKDLARQCSVQKKRKTITRKVAVERGLKAIPQNLLQNLGYPRAEDMVEIELLGEPETSEHVFRFEAMRIAKSLKEIVG